MPNLNKSCSFSISQLAFRDTPPQQDVTKFLKFDILSCCIFRNDLAKKNLSIFLNSAFNSVSENNSLLFSSILKKILYYSENCKISQGFADSIDRSKFGNRKTTLV